jgi:hypothetical protein
MKTLFGSDNARPCWSCGGTIAAYQVDSETSLVDVYCHGCGKRDLFTRDRDLETAAECSAAHRGESLASSMSIDKQRAKVQRGGDALDTIEKTRDEAVRQNLRPARNMRGGQ